ncbi:cysteine--tRNA ligase [Roseivirga spongicola]|uniref:Cysteine--tRNA ligase n=1 Tax=Roseivirga spongicola TaxID=333140 RepID=A0A150X032_9BACT|nr:cysteine--tRNA ligase [Roseivirga spongicola]KYG71912.1 cysteine--tRNA ligase [Roseivirga spongicola]WPZ09042.1 cysteine--tRNA ligase [Roseivirga spongicola]
MSLYEQYPISIYNSLEKEKQVFKPIHEGRVGMYVCGPTVYSDVHLGNVRTFVSFDIIFRYLKFLGYKVRYVRNITDVGHLVGDADEGEDKIAKKARLEELEPMEVVQKYTNGFHDVMQLFNNIPPSIEPTATGHIVEQIEFVQKIIDNGYAYEKDGNVYFDVRRFGQDHEYGELSGRNIDEMLSNTRALSGQDQKNDPLDFALWKKAEGGHLMRWPSPWGEGFPGWHLECSVMSTKYLGETFDIHGGGMDLKFPHHEAEIAQNKGCCHKGGANYWIHGNMLTVNGRKMAKSEGNGFTPEQLLTGDHKLLERGYSAMTVRFFMLMSHYASTLDFSNEALQAAEKGYKRLMASVNLLEKLAKPGTASIDKAKTQELGDIVDKAMKDLSDDFNTAKAIANLFELSTKINTYYQQPSELAVIDPEVFEQVIERFKGIIFDVLGLRNEAEAAQDGKTLDSVMQVLIELRKQAKFSKNYALSDKIRDDLKAAGIQLKDEKGGEMSYTIN